METIILIGAVGYAVLSGLFLVALLQSAARTSDDWKLSTLSNHQTLAETKPRPGSSVWWRGSADTPSLMVADRRRSQVK